MFGEDLMTFDDMLEIMQTNPKYTGYQLEAAPASLLFQQSAEDGEVSTSDSNLETFEERLAAQGWSADTLATAQDPLILDVDALPPYSPSPAYTHHALPAPSSSRLSHTYLSPAPSYRTLTPDLTHSDASSPSSTCGPFTPSPQHSSVHLDIAYSTSTTFENVLDGASPSAFAAKRAKRGHQDDEPLPVAKRARTEKPRSANVFVSADVAPAQPTENANLSLPPPRTHRAPGAPASNARGEYACSICAERGAYNSFTLPRVLERHVQTVHGAAKPWRWDKWADDDDDDGDDERKRQKRAASRRD
ncbi:hypothetical protein K488DRAFT_89845 [Vararia minispora EC-137]|uniref:Uncharacterized protein n=1 Tax=Vararia minispora EC-137 TaxID=1314806 RepID=A0ACB8Q969_9AGAM|nr:hypothetical protein K488DRAFT_89845 [Vararia minispora EC-137]